MSTATVITHLESLIKRAELMAEKLRTSKIRPTRHQVDTFGALGVRLDEAAAKVSGEIEALKLANGPTEECVKLLSEARLSRDSFAAGQINLMIFTRNLALMFDGPKDSQFDSAQTKTKKALTRARCEQIRGRSLDLLILWAIAFRPSLWTAAGGMSNAIFDYLIAELESEKVHTWPSQIHDVLRGLGTEEPLRECDKYHEFVQG